jgi:hypothetical protein
MVVAEGALATKQVNSLLTITSNVYSESSVMKNPCSNLLILCIVLNEQDSPVPTFER